MRTLHATIVLGLLLVGPGLVHAQPKSHKPSCPVGSKLFRGHCVIPTECCLEGVCPDGQIFEFGDEPKCVPCSDAQSQTAMNICAKAAADATESKRKALYDRLLAEFPDSRHQLEEMETAWQNFRDKWCELEADRYEGGTVQPLIFSTCFEAVTSRHIGRLVELRKDWKNK
jgi:uncharacterized protein YecT (DUF1311 family)